MRTVHWPSREAAQASEKLQADRIVEGRARLEALRVKVSQNMACPAQFVGDPGTEEVRRLRKLIKNFRNQVSSFEAVKQDQWRGVEVLWELRRKNEQLRCFRDEHPAIALAIKPQSDKVCDSIE